MATQASRDFSSIPFNFPVVSSKSTQFSVSTLDSFLQSIDKSELVELYTFPTQMIEMNKHQEVTSSPEGSDGFTFVVGRRIPSRTIV